MSLIIVTGSNIGNSLQNLELAKNLLSQELVFIAQSRVYKSEPVDYLEQPDFYNQALEFKPPNKKPEELLLLTQKIEKKIGRNKVIYKGPRNIDIDIIFYDDISFKNETLEIPHPAWSQRSFVVNPIKELPAYQLLRNHFKFPVDFDSIATPI